MRVTCFVTSGSSPLTRGKRYTPRPGASERRLIPAHAGKTWWRPPPSTRCAAHPRSRGENSDPFRMASAVRGSSPLTRGKLPGKQGLHLRPRLIPAHAGKTHLSTYD